MKLINLTNNVVRLFNYKNEQILELPVSDLTPIKAHPVFNNAEKIFIDEIDAHVEIVTPDYMILGGQLPDPEEGVIFVVSYAALRALKVQRHDVIAPDTSPAAGVVKDAEGKVLGVKRFCRKDCA